MNPILGMLISMKTIISLEKDIMEDNQMQDTKLHKLMQSFLKLILSVAITYSIIMCFALLIEYVYWNIDCETTTAGVGKIGVLIPLFTSAIIGASLVRAFYLVLGRLWVFLTIVAAVVGFVVDSGGEFFMAGLFPNIVGLLTTLSVLFAGVIIGYLITRRSRVCRLWVPIVVFLVAFAVLHVLYL